MDVPTLYGRTPRRTPLSLHGVRFVGGESDPFADRAHVRWVADRLIVGAEAETEDDIRLAFVRVSFRGLREWLIGSTPDTSTPLPLVRSAPAGEDAPEAERVDEWVRSLTFDIEGVQVQAIVDRSASSVSAFRTVYETSSWLQLQAEEPLTLSEWRRLWIEPLRDLVLFGTREQTVILSLSGHGPVGSQEISVYGAPDVSIEPPDHVEYHQRDLLPAGIWEADGFEDLVTSWRRLYHRLGAVAQALFEVLNTVDLAPLTRLLRLTSCAEGYHRALHDDPPFSDDEHAHMLTDMIEALPEDRAIRSHYRDRLRHANNQSQRRRIRWLIEQATTVDGRLERQAGKLTSRLVDWRNDHTHLPSEITVPPRDDLLLLNAVLTYVLEANILMDLGLDENVHYCLAHGHVWDDPIPAFLASQVRNGV